MTISRELLMRYHDAEVSEAEACRVEAALEDEPALLAELEAYAELGSFVRASSELSSRGPFDIADSVMAAIEPALPRPQPRIRSLLPKVATWVSLGVAIAAGSMLVVRSWSAPAAQRGVSGAALAASARAPSELAPADPSAAPPELAAALQAEEEPKLPPATIESVDFGGNTGSVFVVSTDSSETPVVWMPDDGEPDEDNEDRFKSL